MSRSSRQERKAAREATQANLAAARANLEQQLRDAQTSGMIVSPSLSDKEIRKAAKRVINTRV